MRGAVLLVAAIAASTAMVAWALQHDAVPQLRAPVLPFATPAGAPPGLPAVQAKLLRVLGDPAESGLAAWPGGIDAVPPVAYDFDGDGVREVVVHSNDTSVYVFRADTGRAVARFTTSYPEGWYIERILNGVAVAPLAPGEPASIVVANHAARVSAWRFDPAHSTADRFAFERRWETALPALAGAASMDARPVLADLDGDGRLEIVVQTEEEGVYALRGNGSILWKQAIGGGNAEPTVADLDADGKPEAIFASDDGRVTVLEGRTGKFLWTFDAKGVAPGPASIPVAPTVADLDGELPLELLLVARDAHDADDFGNDHVTVIAVRGEGGDGELVWSFRPAWAAPLSYTHLAAVDVDGDGSPEVLGMDWNTIGHFPGAWERVGEGHAFALRADGTELWKRPLDSWWSNKDVAVADLDRDGALEVLANGALEGRDGLWALDARTGEPRAFLSADPWKVQRGPALVDLFGRGTTQLLLSVVPADEPGTGAILVYDLGAVADAPWPGHPPLEPWTLEGS
ncbi:MAG TPA: FG-GAP-like repeat-containing protein [Candidatus Thermoplasmatota archaeon]|jgi:outer membrane protein assembly factor BamB|nr:FG-GAP-like repeat-containing protein [Candidatus Thermoplasmatota archaeon]